MEEEIIDIVSKTGKPTGKTALKSEIHRKGYYHNTAHIWFYTEDGKILLAQRAASKAIYPLLWDVSVAGHVDAGETIEQAAIRETQEEISLKIPECDLQKIGFFPCFRSYDSGIIDNEFHHTYIAKLQVPLKNLKPQPGEVEALKLVTFEKFKSLLANSESNSYFVASNRGYYEFVLNVITSHL
ncbi:NUDIX domain-containing protein [Bizionia argentinensis JUB59]|uniref:NUDIX domain-containing protein n=1 Tax=Bizionia argentinensis JUB59 TaxID=1046627 RepID=G2EC96_9FLAO|nr:NUDIX domain-containing protein [Bizionia argentinensis]EGV43925.1 NUDIX domain-containing protein [Bizionia argentinensis JUB59]